MAYPHRASGFPRADPAVIRDHLSRVLVLSDTHWWHDNIAAYHSRPEDHTEMTLQRWHETVRRDDIVLHLGDVVHGIPIRDLWHVFPRRLPGRIYLVPGNHDNRARIEVFLDAGWQLLDPFDLVFRDTVVYFTHEPMLPEEVVDGTINVHGHIHTRPSPSLRHINACVELLDYRPAPLHELLARGLEAG